LCRLPSEHAQFSDDRDRSAPQLVDYLLCAGGRSNRV